MSKLKLNPAMPSTSTPCCKKCKNLFIQIDSYFCPYCGTACLENILMKEKSTASYDPTNPQWKPWREPPPTICLPPIKVNKFRNSEAWRPTMKQPKRIVKKKPIVVNRDFREDSEIDNSDFNPALSTDEVKVYKGQPFQRRGRDEIRKEKLEHLLFPPSEASFQTEVSTCVGEMASDNVDVAVFNRIFPLAVYDSSWLKNLKVSFTSTVHISLIERQIKHSRQHWLRVGIIFEFDDSVDLASPSPLVRAARQSGQIGELITLGYISNEIGRLLNSSCGKDWVDLESIDPHEYYVTSYLQGVLLNIARRCVAVPQHWHTLTQQHVYVCQVRRPGFGSIGTNETVMDGSDSAKKGGSSKLVALWFLPARSTGQEYFTPKSASSPKKRSSGKEFTVDSSGGFGYEPSPTRGDTHGKHSLIPRETTLRELSDGTTQPLSPASYHQGGPDALSVATDEKQDQELQDAQLMGEAEQLRKEEELFSALGLRWGLSFDATTAQVSCRLQLGSFFGPRIPSQVRMSVMFDGQDPVRFLPEIPDPKGRIRASHIVLRITHYPSPKPLVERDAKARAEDVEQLWGPAPKVVVFEARCMQKLLGFGLGGSVVDLEDDQSPADSDGEWSVDKALAAGPKAVTAYLRAVVRLLRLERTANGLRLFVAGASATVSAAAQSVGESADILQWDLPETDPSAEHQDEQHESAGDYEDQQDDALTAIMPSQGEEADGEEDQVDEALSLMQQRAQKIIHACIIIQCMARSTRARRRARERRAALMADAAERDRLVSMQAAAAAAAMAGEAEGVLTTSPPNPLSLQRIVRGTQIHFVGKFESAFLSAASAAGKSPRSAASSSNQPASLGSSSLVEDATTSVGDDENIYNKDEFEGSDANLACPCSLVIEAYEPTSGLKSTLSIDAMTLEFIFSSFEPPPDLHDAPLLSDVLAATGAVLLDGNDFVWSTEEDLLASLEDAEVDVELLMWAQISLDARTQAMLLAEVCEDVDVFLSRENNFMKLKYSSSKLMLC